MILFLLAILSFVWRTGAASDPQDRSPLDDQSALGPRVAITSILLLGMIYLAMIVKTLRRYGSTQAPKRDGGPAQHVFRDNDRPMDTTERESQRPHPKQSHGDMDMEMECRGRERERSKSDRPRRREEEPEKKHTAHI
jgi:hypothetical protein